MGHHHGILVIGLCDLGSPEFGYVGLNETQAALGLLGLGIERELCRTPMAQRKAQAEPARRGYCAEKAWGRFFAI